ncbi:hypothetical protein [Pedobacter sp. NJ-S-72]
MKIRFFHLFTPVLFVSVLISSCKKEENLDDPNVYSWKRELYMRDFTNPFSMSPGTSLSASYSSPRNMLIQTEYVYLTNAQVKTEKQKKKKMRPPAFIFIRTRK